MPTSPADTGADTGARLPDVSALSYEEARDALVRVVNDLEQGASTLEESIALWERGEALAARCEEWLLGAKARLDAARTTASDAR
ncbi:exodeoxyribonuclease VII small subunit [Clavibacter sp. Sh2141]|uniref:exodeoxyribonuclease VII small subunit n=1 Tax=unclassified Clavibacter TaxID=2626594 RepID=UPI0039BCE5CD